MRPARAVPVYGDLTAKKLGVSADDPAEEIAATVKAIISEVEILLEAGLPPEVVQLVHGRGETVGKALVELGKSRKDVVVLDAEPLLPEVTATGDEIGHLRCARFSP